MTRYFALIVFGILSKLASATRLEGCAVLPAGQGAAFGWPRYTGVEDELAFPIRRNITTLWDILHCRDPISQSGGSSAITHSGRIVIRRRVPTRGCNPRAHARLGSLAVNAVPAVGPDEFFVELSGTELHVLVGNHTGRCTHAFPYSVRVPGPYRLRVIRLYRGFDAVSEGIAGWAPVHFDDPLGNDTIVYIGDASAATKPGTVEVQRRAHAKLLSGAGLPRCASPESLAQGRWVSTVPPDEALSPQPLPRQPGTLRRRAWPQPWYINITRLTWVPESCARQRVAPAAARACLANKRVLLQGDSQTRFLFNALIRSVYGARDIVSKRQVADCFVYNKSATGRICYRKDVLASCPLADIAVRSSSDRAWIRASLDGGPRALRRRRRHQYPSPSVTPAPALECDKVHYPLPWDVAAFNVGHHAASVVHWTLRQYGAHVSNRLSQNARDLRHNSTLVWIAPQSSMPAWAAFRRHIRDVRTPPRMRAFDAVTRAHVVSRQSEAFLATRGVTPPAVTIRHLDAYTPSVGVACTAPDGNHITHADFHAVLIEQLLMIACPSASA